MRTYSLRTLFITVAGAATVLALWLAGPSFQIGIVDVLVALAVPPMAAVAAANTERYLRTLFLAVSISTALPVVGYLQKVAVDLQNVPLADPFPDDVPDLQAIELRGGFHFAACRFRPVLVLWAFAPIVSLLAVAVHRIVSAPSER